MIELVTRNLAWKLLALAIAVLLWAAVSNEPELSGFVAAPVEFKDLPETLDITSEVATEVKLELSGPAGELRNFSGARTAVVLDLEDARPGERTYRIGAGDVRLPRGLTLIRTVPAELHLVFERHKERVVGVEPRFSVAPETYKVTPETVTIAGPESRVDRVEAAGTDLIDTRNGEAGTFHVSASVGDPQVRIVGNAEVAVEVPAGK